MLGFGKKASIGVAALFGGAAVKGFYDQVAPATINNAMDIAFGDPEADRAILGTDLTPSMVVAGVGGIPAIDPVVKRGTGAVTGGGVGAAIGGGLGAKMGGGKGAKIGAGIGGAVGGIIGGMFGGYNTNQIARQMNYENFGFETSGTTAAGATMAGTAVGAIGGVYAGAKFGGVKGAIAGGVAGLIGGGAAGAGVGFGPAIQTARNNRQIMTESPFYNQSLLTAERLNASGNIVLGMHNGRRG